MGLELIKRFLLISIASNALIPIPAIEADAFEVSGQAGPWRSEHEREILREFSDLLASPNLANDKANIDRNAKTIRAMLEKRGLTMQLLTLPDAPPIVVGDLIVAGATRTVAFYAHYDSQPVEPSKWKRCRIRSLG